MATHEHTRQYTIPRLVLLLATAGLAIFNGQGFSPIFDSVLYLLTPLLRGTLPAMPMAYFYATSVFITLMTFAIAGIPAALYERVRGHRTSTTVSLSIWLAGTALLAYPAYTAWQNAF